MSIAVVMALVWLFAVAAPAQTLVDSFANRQTISTTNGQIEEVNQNASVEPGEPKHGGKTGGHSLWVSWVAPTNGVIRFDTDSDTYDTLLSAYQFTNLNGSSFADLREVGRSDDAEGDGLNSHVEFGVHAGERYEIAVDGYFGAVGDVELSWNFDELTVPPAKVLSTPPDQAVTVGEMVSLLAVVTNAAGSQFRWFFNGSPIADATSTNLVIASFQPTHVGRYKFRVNSEGVQYFSTPTEIQINTDGAVSTLAQAKILDTPSTPLIGSDLIGSLPAAIPQMFGGGIAEGASSAGVVRGYNGSQIFNTTYAVVETNEPALCGVSGGKSFWLFYQPPKNGTLTLDTIGSTYDTVLATYTYNGALTGYQNLIPLACANNSFGTNGPGRVQIPVVQNRQYLVAVDGVNGAFGTAWLNYSLDTNAPPQPPTLTSLPQPRTVAAGTTVVLTAPVTGSIPLVFAWRKDNSVIPGQNGSSLTLANVTRAQSGNYMFTATNDLGSVSGTFALTVVVPPQCFLERIPDGLQLGFLTLTGQVYRVEESTNLLSHWSPWPGSIAGNGLTNYFTVANSGTKFFRVRVE